MPTPNSLAFDLDAVYEATEMDFERVYTKWVRPRNLVRELELLHRHLDTCGHDVADIASLIVLEQPCRRLEV